MITVDFLRILTYVALSFFCTIAWSTGIAEETDSNGSAAITQTKAFELSGISWMIDSRNIFISSSEEFESKFLPSLDEVLSRNKTLAGAYLMIGWQQVEKEDGKLVLNRVDRILDVIRKHHKYYKLCLVPGEHTPEFVYQKGAQAFETKISNPHQQAEYGKATKIPLPWDEIYRECYFKSIRMISRKYKDDPYFVCVCVAMANFSFPEWHLPKTKEDIALWKTHGNYREKIKMSWIYAIDQFAALFPNQRLCLEASSTPLPEMEKESDQVIEHGILNYPDRFTIQTNQLDGRKDNIEMPSYARIMKYKNRVYHGFQNVSGWASIPVAERQGSMEMTVYNFLQADSKYLEVWSGDGKNAETCFRLNSLIQEARSLGIQKYKEKLVKDGKYLMPDADHYKPPPLR